MEVIEQINGGISSFYISPRNIRSESECSYRSFESNNVNHDIRCNLKMSQKDKSIIHLTKWIKKRKNFRKISSIIFVGVDKNAFKMQKLYVEVKFVYYMPI